MASISKTATGYRAQISVMGERDSQVFRTKREAESWAASRETEIRFNQSTPPKNKFTLADAFTKYAAEVSPGQRGARWEQVRITAFKKTESLPNQRLIGSITTEDLYNYKSQRLEVQKVKPGTFLRDIGLISSVFETARKEWKWIDSNPVHDLRKPPKPKHRDVTIKRAQVRKMLVAMNYTPTVKIKSLTQSMAVCFLVALRTGMRAKELCTLKWVDVHPGYCVLHETKTVSRDVPLTTKAEKLLSRIKNFDDEYVFGITTQTLDAVFRKSRKKAGLEGFTFHDSRHTAATWIAARMKSSDIPAQQAVFDLCKIFGWKNINQALVYYNPSAADIAKRIS